MTHSHVVIVLSFFCLLSLSISSFLSKSSWFFGETGKKNFNKNKKWQNCQEDRVPGGDLVQELPKISKAGWSQWGIVIILIPLLNWSRTPGVPGGVEIYPRLSLLEIKWNHPDILYWHLCQSKFNHKLNRYIAKDQFKMALQWAKFV